MGHNVNATVSFVTHLTLSIFRLKISFTGLTDRQNQLLNSFAYARAG